MFCNFHSCAFLTVHFTSGRVTAEEGSPAEAQKINEKDGEAIPFSFVCVCVLVSFFNTGENVKAIKTEKIKSWDLREKSYFP